jgi:long-chain acyl-CoA synthetase
VDKRWLEHYQKGVPHSINPNEYSSLVELIDKSCSTHSTRVAYISFGNALTYNALESLSRDFASYLQSLGLEKGARVAIMMPNTLQYPVVIYAILRAGYMVVNTNPLYTPNELIHQMNDAGAETIIVMANFATTVEKALPMMPKVKNIIVTELGDLFPTFKRIIVNFVVKHIKKMVPAFHLPQATSFRDAIKKGKQLPFKKVEVTQDDIAFLQYTGGTTGVAKGAMLSHGNMVANVLQARSWVDPLVKVHEETVITALPLYHIFSLTANCLTFLCYGAKNILITNPRDIPQFIDTIKDSKFTVITGVNTLFNALLNHPKFDTIDFSHLKIALSGGMALQKSVSLRWRERTKSRVLEAYGLTETSPAATMNPMYLEEYNGSIGPPIPSTDVRIINDDEEDVPIGDTGELCIKGPQVMKGYWHKPEETALVFTKDGFLKTGDIVRMDTEGYIYLVDRKKDIVIVSGFNVYPNEVEQVIGMCPGVLEVGVIGVPDERSGEAVKACVVKSDPDLTAETIIAYCRENLSAYKVPKIIEFYKELPKTNVGKILRRALS